MSELLRHGILGVFLGVLPNDSDFGVSGDSDLAALTAVIAKLLFKERTWPGVLAQSSARPPSGKGGGVARF